MTIGPERKEVGTRARFRFGNVVNVMTTPPPFFCKDVILKGLERECMQECDSKAVRYFPILQRVDAKGFEAAGNPTRREFIGGLERIRAGARIVQDNVAQKLSNVNW